VLDRLDIDDLKERLLSGPRTHGGLITIRIIDYEQLWVVGARDAKTLVAWSLYEALKRARHPALDKDESPMSAKRQRLLRYSGPFLEPSLDEVRRHSDSHSDDALLNKNKAKSEVDDPYSRIFFGLPLAGLYGKIVGRLQLCKFRQTYFNLVWFFRALNSVTTRLNLLQRNC